MYFPDEWTWHITILEKWRYFLEGAASPVEIWTDHKNFKYFIIAKKLNHY